MTESKAESPDYTLGEQADAFDQIARRFATAITKGDLGMILADEISRYSLWDLQIIGGGLYAEIIKLPRPYRDQVHPYMTEQLWGAYNKLIVMHSSGKFLSMKEHIRDRDIFLRFCEMIPKGCFEWDQESFRYSPRHWFFYYLIAAFTMFVLDHPGHPAGTPFPGGFKVEEHNGTFKCLLRDQEKEVWFSICNFCPAHQTTGV